jgi:hypothetical protein
MAGPGDSAVESVLVAHRMARTHGCPRLPPLGCAFARAVASGPVPVRRCGAEAVNRQIPTSKPPPRVVRPSQLLYRDVTVTNLGHDHVMGGIGGDVPAHLRVHGHTGRAIARATARAIAPPGGRSPRCRSSLRALGPGAHRARARADPRSRGAGWWWQHPPPRQSVTGGAALHWFSDASLRAEQQDLVSMRAIAWLSVPGSQPTIAPSR